MSTSVCGAVLSVEHGCFGYEDSSVVLCNVSFSVASGEVVAILGPNGGGKTTLLRCIMGLLKWREGRCMVCGSDVSGLSSRELFRLLSYVPQSRGLVPSYSVTDMVLLGRGSRIGMLSQPSALDYEVVASCLERLGISHLAQKRCTELSGGELQMTLIARAMAAQSKVIVLDEPESSLDFRNQMMVMKALQSLKEMGVGVLFNTHYPSHALQYADKALLLSNDGTAVFGSSFSVVTEEAIGKAFGVRAVIDRVSVGEGVVYDVIPVDLK